MGKDAKRPRSEPQASEGGLPQGKVDVKQLLEGMRAQLERDQTRL